MPNLSALKPSSTSEQRVADRIKLYHDGLRLKAIKERSDVKPDIHITEKTSNTVLLKEILERRQADRAESKWEANKVLIPRREDEASEWMGR